LLATYMENEMSKYVEWFYEIGLEDVSDVGYKNTPSKTFFTGQNNEFPNLTNIAYFLGKKINKQNIALEFTNNIQTILEIEQK